MEKEAKEIMEMYNGVKAVVRLEDKRSEWFNVNVGVHQGLVFSPLLFCLLLDEITKDVTECILKEFLYAYDLVLLGRKLRRDKITGKKALNEKGVRINESKTKVFPAAKKTISASKIVPWAVCRKRVSCDQGCGSGSGSFSVEAEAGEFYRFRFHIGYLT